jgi:hypothetical protein
MIDLQVRRRALREDWWWLSASDANIVICIDLYIVQTKHRLEGCLIPEDEHSGLIFPSGHKHCSNMINGVGGSIWIS